MTVAIPSSAGMSIHPRFEKLHAGESRQASDRVVDPASRDPTLLAIEEVLRHELELTRRADSAADRSPEVVDEEARDAGGGRGPQSLLGLTVVEEEVAGFIAHDPLEQLAQHRVLGDGSESEVARQRRELVDGAPGHVDRTEVGPRARQHRRRARLQPLRERLPAARLRPRWYGVAGRLEKAGQRD